MPTSEHPSGPPAPPMIDPCTRCGGSGRYASARTHQGIPGLCLDCDGDGRGETQRRNRAAVRERGERNAGRAVRMQASEAPVRALRERAGTGHAIPRERRERFALDEIFTTAAYAEACGIAREAAFRELALAFPAIHVAFDDDGHAVGWRREF